MPAVVKLDSIQGLFRLSLTAFLLKHLKPSHHYRTLHSYVEYIPKTLIFTTIVADLSFKTTAKNMESNIQNNIWNMNGSLMLYKWVKEIFVTVFRGWGLGFVRIVWVQALGVTYYIMMIQELSSPYWQNTAYIHSTVRAYSLHYTAHFSSKQLPHRTDETEWQRLCSWTEMPIDQCVRYERCTKTAGSEPVLHPLLYWTWTRISIQAWASIN